MISLTSQPMLACNNEENFFAVQLKIMSDYKVEGNIK